MRIVTDFQYVSASLLEGVAEVLLEQTNEESCSAVLYLHLRVHRIGCELGVRLHRFLLHIREKSFKS